jgi:hypothetical protein
VRRVLTTLRSLRHGAHVHCLGPSGFGYVELDLLVLVETAPDVLLSSLT